MTDAHPLSLRDPEQQERAEAFAGNLQSVDHRALGVALASGAFALTARPAYGQAMPSVNEVLNFALLLEYLELRFYQEGNTTETISANASGDYNAAGKYQEIEQNEEDHVSLLEDALGEAARDEPAFDFTAGGAFAPFGPTRENYVQFLVLSQAFEDTGVRAYKGGAPALVGNPDVLTTALQIHSVEARHASVVRRLLNDEDVTTQDGWIEGAGANAPIDAIAPVYAGEDDQTVAGLDVSGATDPDGNSYSSELLTEAYDEPLGIQAVLEIVDQFVVGEDLDGDGNPG